MSIQAARKTLAAARVDIKGLNKVHVLQALFTHAIHNGEQRPATPSVMSFAEAQALLEVGEWFDHLHQRRMFVDLAEDSMSSLLYDQYNGAGAAEAAINHLRVAAVV
jgi:hypothetical protein